MPTAREIATELRQIADSLDGSELEMGTPVLGFYGYSNPKIFFNALELIPRPFAAAEDKHNYDITAKATSFSAVNVRVTARREDVLTVSEPAKPATYHPDPRLITALGE